MKKFLSILLALAVGFTFTFGSAMSAFAGNSTKYDENEQKALLANAYNSALAEAAAYNYDFDSKLYTGTTADNDLTMIKISDTAVKVGIAAAYDAVLAKITGTSTSIDDIIAGVNAGDYDAELNNASTSTDFVVVKKALLEAAKAGGAQEDKVMEAAFADFKTYLAGIIDSVDIKDYTSTVQEDKYTACDGELYDTAAKAAAADIAYAKAVVSHAKFKDAELTAAGKTTPKADADWTVASYDALYDAIIGDNLVIKVSENKDDAIHEDYVTSLTYKLVAKDHTPGLNRTFATTKSEAADDANDAVTRASAKAALLAAITTYENANTLKANAKAQLDAYNEAMTYIIENDAITLIPTSFTLTTVTKDGVNGINYTRLTDAANAVKADVPVKKAYNEARGLNWDEKASEKSLKAQLLVIYKVTDNTATVAKTFNTAGVVSSDLTAGMKASYKVDYSEIEAEDDSTCHGKVYTLKDYDETIIGCYYEKEWSEVKAVIDTYNAAVDAAKVEADITGTEGVKAVRNAALAKIATAANVYGDVDDATSSYSALKAYAGLAYKNAKNADATIQKIYVTFGDITSEITAENGSDLNDESVYLWAIDKGARNAKEVAALYADACKVIDGYKTLATLKTEAAAVASQIAALPANPTLADKAAVVAAYDAYDALTADAKNYVTNYTTLVAAIRTVEKLEAYDVKAKINALPAESKVTFADKEAVDAAKKAYEDYDETTAYAALTSKTLNAAGYNFTTALASAEADALKAINSAYQALNNKYVADKLTAEDAEAVKSLQDAIAAYIDEYAVSPGTDIENTTAKIAAVVAALAPAFGDAEAKAYVQDLAIAVRTAKSGKKVKVTVNADVQTLIDNGYTVEYKFYKSTKKSSGYKNTVNKTTNTYTNTNPVKGKNYYKVKLVVKNADGTVVATTPLTQCKYGVRTIK